MDNIDNYLNFEEDINSLELEERIDAKPKKKIIINKAKRCSFQNAMAEIVDNCIDYWTDIDKKNDLVISINTKNTDSENPSTLITWNMGIPRERWRPLLTPGEAVHRAGESIGTWGEGFKIAIFSTGRQIDIWTRNPGKDNHIHIPADFLNRDDWIIDVYKSTGTMNIPENTTMLRLKGKAFNEIPVDTYPLKQFLAITFGTRIKQEQQNGQNIIIKFNEKIIDPITFAAPEDIKRNFSFPPGFEPSEHIFHIPGLTIKMIIGILHTMDAENYGVYLYGNGRLFASKLRNEQVGFGGRKNSPIPADHPLSKRMQIHVFFEGDPENIPWQAPLKDGLMEKHWVIEYVADNIRNYASPYAEFMIKAKTPELTFFSTKKNNLEEGKLFTNLLTKEERDKVEKQDSQGMEIQKKWKDSLPEIKKEFIPPEELEVWDHSESGKGRKPSENAKFDRQKAKNIIKNTIVKRDLNEISSLDLFNNLKERSSENKITPFVSQGINTVAEAIGENLFDPDEGSITLSIRMDAKEANQLAKIAGEKQKSQLLKYIIEKYKIIQDFKLHPYFINKKEAWTDDEIIQELKNILDKKR